MTPFPTPGTRTARLWSCTRPNPGTVSVHVSSSVASPYWASVVETHRAASLSYGLPGVRFGNRRASWDVRDQAAAPSNDDGRAGAAIGPPRDVVRARIATATSTASEALRTSLVSIGLSTVPRRGLRERS